MHMDDLSSRATQGYSLKDRQATMSPLDKLRSRGREPQLMLVASWVMAWIWAARYYYRDDALIHLRYADMLRDRGFLTFDGVHPSHGTSSLLYVALLAVAGRLAYTIFLPKVLSVLGYVALLGLILRRSLKAEGIAPRLWFLLLI